MVLPINPDPRQTPSDDIDITLVNGMFLLHSMTNIPTTFGGIAASIFVRCLKEQNLFATLTSLIKESLTCKT